MIEAGFFYEALAKQGVGFFTGVPDSLLKSFCAYITDHTEARQHIIAVNEGAAIGLAAGYHLASGNIPLAYMQNSGLGDAANLLLFLTDAELYSMVNVAKSILENERCLEADSLCMPIKQILELIPGGK